MLALVTIVTAATTISEFLFNKVPWDFLTVTFTLLAAGWFFYWQWRRGDKIPLPQTEVQKSANILRELQLLPSSYLEYRVFRKTLVDAGYDILRHNPYLVIIGEAGTGKSALALEIAARYKLYHPHYELTSVSWNDIMSRDFEESEVKLLKALSKERLADYQGIIVLHDFERSAEFYANRWIASRITAKFARFPNNIKLIVTSRPADIEIGAERYVHHPDSERSTNDKSSIRKKVLHVSPLRDEEEWKIIRSLVKSRSKWQTLMDHAERCSLSPLETVLLCELTNIENTVSPDLWNLCPIDNNEEVLPGPIGYIARSFRVVVLYERLLKLSPSFSILKKVIEAGSVGLQRSLVPITPLLGAELDTMRGSNHLFVQRSEERGARRLENGDHNYELAHPTVNYLSAIRGLVGSLARHEIDPSRLSPCEQQIFETYFAIRDRSKPTINLPHEIIEHEPFAVCLLLADAIGCREIVLAYLVLVGENKDDHVECGQVIAECEDEVAKSIKANCVRNPKLVLTACRLAETLYQQLDHWNIAGLIITELSNYVFGESVEIYKWSRPRDGESCYAYLGREYLRQSLIIHYLEENLNTSGSAMRPEDIGDGCINKELLLQLENDLPPKEVEFSHLELALSIWSNEDDSREIRLAFAGYCVTIANVHSAEFRMRAVVSFALQAISSFKDLKCTADALRSMLNLAYAYIALDLTEDPAGHENDLADLLGLDQSAITLFEFLNGHIERLPVKNQVLREECAQELVYGLLIAARLRLAQNPCDHGVCRQLLSRAQEINSSYPGDEWVSFQFEFLKLELELVETVDRMQSGVEVPDIVFEQLDVRRKAVFRQALPFLRSIDEGYDTVVALWLDKLCYHAIARNRYGSLTDYRLDLLMCDSSIPLRLLINVGEDGHGASVVDESHIRGKGVSATGMFGAGTSDHLVQTDDATKVRGIGYKASSTGVDRLEWDATHDLLAEWDAADLYEGVEGDRLMFHAMLRVSEILQLSYSSEVERLTKEYPRDSEKVAILNQCYSSEQLSAAKKRLDQCVPDFPNVTWRDMVHRFYPQLSSGKFILPPGMFIEPLLYRGVPKGLSLVCINQTRNL